MRILNGVLALILVFSLTGIPSARAGFSDEYLEGVQGAFDARRTQLLESQISAPWPDINTHAGSKLNYALSVLFQDREAAVVASGGLSANQAIIDACDIYLNDPVQWEGSFYWDALKICRLYEFYSQTSSRFPGRLNAQT
jgi:hypothetical protein